MDIKISVFALKSGIRATVEILKGRVFDLLLLFCICATTYFLVKLLSVRSSGLF